MKTVGILAGLGPLAGAHFYRRVVELSPASNDQEHLRTLMISDPTIPSRIAHLNGTGLSPVPALQQVVQQLEAAGADFIVMPSTTTSIYLPELRKSAKVPMISLIDEVTQEIAQLGLKTVGVLATTPTRTYGVYANAFQAADIDSVYPDDVSQDEVMRIIGQVKAGVVGESTDAIYEIACRPWSWGVDGLLLACTEVPVIFPLDAEHRFANEPFVENQWRSPRVLSATDILARAVVRIGFGGAGA